MIVIEKEGKTVEAALEAALTELNLTANDVEVEVLRKEGLFKSACIRVTAKAGLEDKALAFVEELIAKMNLTTKAELITVEDAPVINLVGEDNGIAIGYRGEVLDAIQYLTILAINKGSEEYTKIVVDAENYRNKRKQTLENLAERLADKAIRSGKTIEVEPMNPYERKVFHTALSDNPEVTTESEGEEPNRYILIRPVNKDNSFVPQSDFNRKGVGKLRSFGEKKRKF